MAMAPRRPRSAFTITELLVVIGIIGVLAGILVPAILHVKVRAGSTDCKSNLHQVGIALTAYGQKYNGLLPHIDSDGLATGAPGNFGWRDKVGEMLALQGKTAAVCQCPSWEKYDELNTTNQGYTYKINQHLSMLNQTIGSWTNGPYAPHPGSQPTTGAYAGYYFFTPSRAPSAGKSILIFDGDAGVTAYGSRASTDGRRHGGETNLLMMDMTVVGFDAEGEVGLNSGGDWKTWGPFIWQPLKGKVGDPAQ